jgi:hypothetical protein
MLNLDQSYEVTSKTWMGVTASIIFGTVSTFLLAVVVLLVPVDDNKINTLDVETQTISQNKSDNNNISDARTTVKKQARKV